MIETSSPFLACSERWDRIGLLPTKRKVTFCRVSVSIWSKVYPPEVSASIAVKWYIREKATFASLIGILTKAKFSIEGSRDETIVRIAISSPNSNSPLSTRKEPYSRTLTKKNTLTKPDTKERWIFIFPKPNNFSCEVAKIKSFTLAKIPCLLLIFISLIPWRELI